MRPLCARLSPNERDLWLTPNDDHRKRILPTRVASVRAGSANQVGGQPSVRYPVAHCCHATFRRHSWHQHTAACRARPDLATPWAAVAGARLRGSALCGYTPEVRNELAQSRDHGPTTDVRKSGEERGVAFSPTLQEVRGNDEGPCVLRWRDSSKDHQAAERVCDALEIESLARAAGRRARYARVRAAGGSPGQI